jgi:hypothetical protein
MALALVKTKSKAVEKLLDIKGLERLCRYEWAEEGYWIVTKTADNNEPLSDKMKEDLVSYGLYCEILNEDRQM